MATATTTTTTTTTITNDRASTIKSAPDGSEPATSSASAPSASSTVSIPLSSSTDTVVASYTIIAPSATKADTNTATFTIPSPSAQLSTTTNASASATINVLPPLSTQSTNHTKKTDLDMVSPKLSPSNVQISFNFSKSTAEKVPIADKTIASSPVDCGDRTTDNVIALGITDDDKNDKINTAAVNKTAAATQKQRSLFELDNASSLSLADKLRNEANKYADVSDSEKGMKKPSNSNPTSPTSYQPPPSSERRPSWRLKLDAGSKVCIHSICHHIWLANHVFL